MKIRKTAHAAPVRGVVVAGKNELICKTLYSARSAVSRPAPGDLVAALLILAHSPFLDANDRALTWAWFDPGEAFKKLKEAIEGKESLARMIVYVQQQLNDTYDTDPDPKFRQRPKV